jgi:DNA mismatch repair protein MutS
VIAPGYSADLDELRAIQDNCGAFLVELEARERERSGIASLKVEFNKVHGFYIEVTHANVDKIPDDYRRRQTLKNAERYITPELKAFEDKALSANERALALESSSGTNCWARWQRTSRRCRRSPAPSPNSTAWWPLPTAALRHDYRAAGIRDEAVIEIEAGRHPVVERQVDSFIANDTRLAAQRRMLLITGPNMGGKSTYMRQAALIVLLAHCGSFVPATRCRLGPIDAIYTRIGASDDLASGRSTFMVEMTEAAAILNGATEKSLVLMDEIGRGTSTFDGVALAFAIARHLLEKNRAWTLFLDALLRTDAAGAGFTDLRQYPPRRRRTRPQDHLPACRRGRPGVAKLRRAGRGAGRHAAGRGARSQAATDAARKSGGGFPAAAGLVRQRPAPARAAAPGAGCAARPESRTT